MALLIVGIVLLALKLAEIGPVAAWSWWLVLLPFGLAAAWWGFADATGLTQRRAMDKMDERKASAATATWRRWAWRRDRRKAPRKPVAARQRATPRPARRRRRPPTAPAGSVALRQSNLSSTAPQLALEALLRELGQHAARVARRRLLPGGAAARQFGVVDVQLQQQLVGVDGDRVAFVHQRDLAAVVGLGRHVADHHAPGAAGEAAVGDQAHALAQALADQRAGGRQHLGHARAALGAQVAQHHHVAGDDLAWP